MNHAQLDQVSLISLDRCDGIGNTVEDPFGRTHFPIKQKMKVSSMIKEIDVSKTLIKHFPRQFRHEGDGRKCNSKQPWNRNKSM